MLSFEIYVIKCHRDLHTLKDVHSSRGFVCSFPASFRSTFLGFSFFLCLAFYLKLKFLNPNLLILSPFCFPCLCCKSPKVTCGTGQDILR